MTFAGLWDEWNDHAGSEKLKSCTMIVTERERRRCRDT
jgi:putative SOS response-associated peptidase YedK